MLVGHTGKLSTFLGGFLAGLSFFVIFCHFCSPLKTLLSQKWLKWVIKAKMTDFAFFSTSRPNWVVRCMAKLLSRVFPTSTSSLFHICANNELGRPFFRFQRPRGAVSEIDYFWQNVKKNGWKSLFSAMTCDCLDQLFWAVRASWVFFLTLFVVFSQFSSVFAFQPPPYKRSWPGKWLKWVIKGRKIAKNRCFQIWSPRVFVHVLGHFYQFYGQFWSFLDIFGGQKQGKWPKWRFEMVQKSVKIGFFQ